MAACAFRTGSTERQQKKVVDLGYQSKVLIRAEVMCDI